MAAVDEDSRPVGVFDGGVYFQAEVGGERGAHCVGFYGGDWGGEDGGVVEAAWEAEMAHGLR